MAANSQDPFLRMTTKDGMQEVDYTDELGRNFKVLVKEGGDPSRGIVKGPPIMDGLGLGEAATTRLHNNLYASGIITAHEAMRQPDKVAGAIQQALRVNVQQIQNIYLGLEVQAPPRPEPRPPIVPIPSHEPVQAQAPIQGTTPASNTPLGSITPTTQATTDEEDVTDAR